MSSWSYLWNWDWIVAVLGILMMAVLTYYKPVKETRTIRRYKLLWLTDARYYQLSISLIGLASFAIRLITIGECLIIVILGWMISLRFEE